MADTKEKWYSGIAMWQWVALIIASAGWVFDIYEGQIFNITRTQLLSNVMNLPFDAPEIKLWGDILLGIFLLGGAFGGMFFGSLADRWGRRPTMIVTILVYSAFSGLTFFAQTVWQVAVLRFLVAMGVGGEWAVAAALVSEVFPTRSRAYASAIFHASSIFGTFLAAFAGMAVQSHWRYAYIIGVVPALLTLWVRASVREPEWWAKAEARAEKATDDRLGSFRDLLTDPRWRGRAILGMLLATVGLGSFWGVTIEGQGLARDLLIRQGVDPQTAIEKAKFAYGIIETIGGGIGLLAFGPLCTWLGRRMAFILIQALAVPVTAIACYGAPTYGWLLFILPFFGFFTLGIHAGYAVYFPELFPTRLRATGAGFCFNGGRILSALMLVFSGWLKGLPDMKLPNAVFLLSLVFLFGVVIVWFMPETKNQPLPE